MAANLGGEYLPRLQTLNTRPQTGGKTRKRVHFHNKTNTKGRGAYLHLFSFKTPI